jgi:DNA-binding PadR family transcriptional regulator
LPYKGEEIGMSSKHALLGLLLDRPAYPYQLADRMQQRLGPSWKVADYGTFYKAVKRLERDGLIERVNKDPAVQEDRHVFAITERGIEEFERWFASASDGVSMPRRPLLAKITLAGPHRLAQAMERIDEYECGCAERLAAIEGMRDALPGADREFLRVDDLLLRLNLSADIYTLEVELRWAREARELLAWLAVQEHAVWPSQAGNGSGPAGANARTRLFTRIAGATGEQGEHSDPARERARAPKPLAG